MVEIERNVSDKQVRLSVTHIHTHTQFALNVVVI